MNERFLELIEKSINKHWDLPALTDHNSATYYYKDVAERIAKLHIIFEQANIQKGDKIAIMGRNSSHWAMSFLGVVSYGAVAVPVLNDFKPENVHHIIAHSEAKFFLLTDVNWENLDRSAMPAVVCYLSLDNFAVLYSQQPGVGEQIDARFKELYPDGIKPGRLKYYLEEAEELALINYTSGTTGFSKGVMLPYRSLWGNTRFASDCLWFIGTGDRMVCMLPMAHMYGLAFDLCHSINKGCHIHFLPRIPNPKTVLETFAAVRPKMVIAVPLIIEKIVRNRIFPELKKPHMKILLNIPLVNRLIKKKICEKLNNAFGGEFFQVVLGGAPVNKDIEAFLRDIGFKYTIGYGMTECGPLLTYAQWDKCKAASAGYVIDRVQLKIDSANPETEIGEILVSGCNNMLGYYKNPEATAEVMLPDGWMRTGDLGTIDKDGTVFIRGRSKALILSASGQNIYPEEIESALNNLPYISESVVIQKQDKLIGLVYPDWENVEKKGLSEEELQAIMTNNMDTLNQKMPNYNRLSEIHLRREPFEKTPKQSIKRFLYQAEG